MKRHMRLVIGTLIRTFLTSVLVLAPFTVWIAFAGGDFSYPDDDSWVDNDSPAANHDEDNGLQVGFSNFMGFARTLFVYLRFDVSGLDEAFVSTDKLRLYVESIQVASDLAGEELELYSVSDDWNAGGSSNGDETDLTYESKPPTSSLLDTQTIPSAGNWVEFNGQDMADYLNNERNGDGLASFMVQIKNYSGDHFGGGLRFEDRENTLDTMKLPALRMVRESSQVISGAGDYTFGTTGATMHFNSEDIDSVQVRVYRYAYPNATSTNVVKRYYQITSSGGSGIFNVDLTLSYTQDEFNASAIVNESDLVLYRSNSDTGTWDNMGATSVDSENNKVTLNNVTAFSTWVLGSNDEGPTAVTIRSIRAWSPSVSNWPIILLFGAALTLGGLTLVRCREQLV
jgi:hypothetical protein